MSIQPEGNVGLARATEKGPEALASYLEQLFESAPEGIVVLDKEMRIVRANREFVRMFGWEISEALGKPVDDLILPDDIRSDAVLLTETVMEGHSVTLETRRRCKDGTLVDVSLLGTPVFGNPDVSAYVIYRDISERKQADVLQSALYKIAEKASSAEDLQELYSAIHSILSELMYAKNCYIALYDRESDIVSFPYFVDEKDPPFPPHKSRRGLTEYVLRSGQPLLATPEMLNELVRRGEVARIGAPSLDWMGVPLKLGDVTFGVLTVQSYETKIRYGEKEKELLTFVSRQVASAIEHKRNQDAIRQSESKFRALAESASQAIYIFDDRRFLYVNPATERILGYSREELLAMEDAWAIVRPEFREEARSQSAALKKGSAVRYEFSVLTKTGVTRWLDFSASPIEFGGNPAAVATAVDVTDRKRAEQLQRALYRIADETSSAKDLANLYRGLHSIVGELMYAKNFYIAIYDDPSKTITYPYAVDEVDEFPSDRVPCGRGLTEYVLRTGQALLATPELFYQLLDRKEIEVVGTPAVDWLGVPLMKGDQAFGVLAVQSYDQNVRYGQSAKDILTFVSQHVVSAIEHKRNQDALRASEARYRSLVQSAVYGIYQSSMEEGFIHVNPALIAMLGYASENEVLRLKLGEEIYVDPSQHRSVIQTLSSAGRLDGMEAQWRRKDGSRFVVRLSGRKIQSDAGGEVTGFEMIAEDVTERRLLEEQLRQSQRMEAVGQLAGGIAHDFNNLLTVIKGNSDLLLDDLPNNDVRRTEVEEIQRAASRAAALTRQLLAFSRKQVLAPKVLRLNSIVSNMEKLLKRLLGEHIELVSHCDPSVGAVKADPGQLEQVIMNLALNARDAMPHGGTLQIQTHNIDISESDARDRLEFQPGRYVMLEVKDTGIGMDEETLLHAFEPFFTTKRMGEGTGLGLSTVYGIVKQSDGHIRVESQVGTGSTFRVYLPRMDDPEDASDTVKIEAVESRRGHENILVVEDEEGVRSLIKNVLERNGYTVLEARNGVEALRTLEQKETLIDMLLTDIILPHMSGRELVERISGLRPKMKICFMSGYTDDAILKHGILDSATSFLQKPFTTESLIRKIREVLES